MAVQTPALVQDPVCSAPGSLVSVSTVVSSRNSFQIFPQVCPWLNFPHLSGVTSNNTSSARPSRPPRQSVCPPPPTTLSRATTFFKVLITS